MKNQRHRQRAPSDYEEVEYYEPGSGRLIEAERVPVQRAPVHRQGRYIGTQPVDMPYTTDEQRVNPLDVADHINFDTNPNRTQTSAHHTTNSYQSNRRPKSQPADAEEILDEPWPTHQRTTARRYDQPHETTRQLAPKPTRIIRSRRFSFSRERLLIWLGVGMLIMLLGWLALSALGQWWQGVQDNWTFGTPRTFQIDEYVGHGDTPAQPDHFIALNIHNEVIVVELNLQRLQYDHIYGITTTTDPSIPVTVSFREVNGQQRMDVSVGHADSNPYTVELVNNGKSFAPAQQH